MTVSCGLHQTSIRSFGLNHHSHAMFLLLSVCNFSFISSKRFQIRNTGETKPENVEQNAFKVLLFLNSKTPLFQRKAFPIRQLSFVFCHLDSLISPLAQKRLTAWRTRLNSQVISPSKNLFLRY